jgi:DNA polymerase-1
MYSNNVYFCPPHKFGKKSAAADIMKELNMKLLAIDGNSILNRAFYGIKLLSNKKGEFTNAIFGFMNIYLRNIGDVKPDSVAVAFDLRSHTFRHKAVSYYKANRKGMPPELAQQLPKVKELLTLMGVKVVECEGYEADDILGTLSKLCSDSGNECYVLTGDRDSLQLIDDKVTVILATNKENIYYTPEKFNEDYGFEPIKLIDLKALMGDSSDNIPGVPGIGEKTALDLLHRYGSLEKIYADLDSLDVKEGVRKKLREGEESARLSYWLATILREVPLAFSPEDNRWDHHYGPGLYELMKRLGFLKFIEKWGLEPTREAVLTADAAAMPHLELDEQSAGTLTATLPGKRVAILSADGNEGVPLVSGDQIVVRRSERSVLLAETGAKSFFDRAFEELSG